MLNLSKVTFTEISIFCVMWFCTERSYLGKIGAQRQVWTSICYCLSVTNCVTAAPTVRASKENTRNGSTNCMDLKLSKLVSFWVKLVFVIPPRAPMNCLEMFHRYLPLCDELMYIYAQSVTVHRTLSSDQKLLSLSLCQRGINQPSTIADRFHALIILNPKEACACRLNAAVWIYNSNILSKTVVKI